MKKSKPVPPPPPVFEMVPPWDMIPAEPMPSALRKQALRDFPAMRAPEGKPLH